jgi:hypothetical protein
MPRFFRPRLTWLAGIAGVFFGLLVVAVYAVHFGSELSGSHERWGQFGEYIGGVLGPLLSFFALIAVVGTMDDARRQQFDASFFNLMQSLVRIREGKTLVASPGVVSTLASRAHVLEMSMHLAAREAWEALKRLLNERTEHTEDAARAHLVEIAGGSIRQQYNDVFRLTEKVFQIYRFIYRARLTPEERSYYVEIVNSEITPIEHLLLLFALLTQPRDGAALKVVNDMRVFLALDVRWLGMPPVYCNVLRAYYPHLPIHPGDRPVVSI